MRIPDHGFSRRRVLELSALGLLAGAFPMGLSGCTTTTHADALVVAGGEAGGLYHEFATLLAEALQRYSVATSATALMTQASADNIALLLDGTAQLGLALADSVAASPAVAEGKIFTLGRVYQNYFHLLVRREEAIGTVQDLAGQRLGTGAPGSGTWLTGQRILQAAGLKDTGQEASEQRLGLNDGLEALADDRIDAMMISGGIAINSIEQLNRSTPLRLLDLASLIPDLRADHPGLYDRVVIPQDTYSGMETVHTIGVSNLLLGRADLPDNLVEATVRLLIEHAGELVPSSSAGIQFLSPDNLIATSGQPLHPAAAETYRRIHG
ncbi:TAXI family TRAP transporter solute-binding subunit [Glutamicibacter sp. MNS18]|uniref:TAXI family TRAP transporter solute-binding subunit n=1 Tax=Glutamicibacter sp. MNS18 TaxID=2989817 RepID=UPI0022358F5D|nr:TAXI family TRAP transporter solute-binding subunit [Glutamicibacter sp. MNS18]MCW4464919.1 TAXI family TRAP transporter solute-binding subunit [Glutamicibacter sp. MNS18]